VERSATGAAIERALADLAEPLRETIVLREVDGLSYKEIAAVLHLPIGTVMSRLSRARAQLEQAPRPRGRRCGHELRGEPTSARGILDDELERPLRDAVEAHVARCEACAQALARHRLLGDAAARARAAGRGPCGAAGLARAAVRGEARRTRHDGRAPPTRRRRPAWGGAAGSPPGSRWRPAWRSRWASRNSSPRVTCSHASWWPRTFAPRSRDTSRM
jgi:hypothetical protein